MTGKCIRSVKGLCLLKGVLCCHNSCAILKPLHCILVQSARPNQYFSLSTRRELRQTYLEIMVSFQCVLLVFRARPPRWPNPAKINYVHYDRDFVEAISFAFAFDSPPAHRPGELLSGRARRGSVKCAGAPFCIKCRNVELRVCVCISFAFRGGDNRHLISCIYFRVMLWAL